MPYNAPTDVQPGAQRRVGWDDVTYAIGDGTLGNVRNVTVRLLDRGVAVVGPRLFTMWLSDDADGTGLAASAPNLQILAEGQVLHEVVADKLVVALSNAAGLAAVAIGPQAGADTFYLAVADPQGAVHVSAAIEFAA